MIKRVLTALAATLPLPLGAHAADAITGAVQRQPTNWQAIVMFLIFVALTLYITYWASKTGAFAQRITTPPAAILPASRTGWRLPATLCQRRRSSVSPRWCIPPATMG